MQLDEYKGSLAVEKEEYISLSASSKQLIKFNVEIPFEIDHTFQWSVWFRHVFSGAFNVLGTGQCLLRFLYACISIGKWMMLQFRINQIHI